MYNATADVTILLSGNLDVIFYKNNQNLQKYFLQGVQSGFFYINANKKRNAKVNFIDFSQTEILGCEIFRSNTKKNYICRR